MRTDGCAAALPAHRCGCDRSESGGASWKNRTVENPSVYSNGIVNLFEVRTQKNPVSQKFAFELKIILN